MGLETFCPRRRLESRLGQVKQRVFFFFSRTYLHSHTAHHSLSLDLSPLILEFLGLLSLKDLSRWQEAPQEEEFVFFFFVIELKVDIKIQDIYKVMQYKMSN